MVGQRAQQEEISLRPNDAKPVVEIFKCPTKKRPFYWALEGPKTLIRIKQGVLNRSTRTQRSRCIKIRQEELAIHFFRRRRNPSMATQNKRPRRISWINELGDDLLVEIVNRSSPDLKSASRCKAVCKRWNSLISSPCFNRRFVTEQQKKKRKMTKLLQQNKLISVISSFLPPIPGRVRGEKETLHVLDCSEDLVLCGVWDPDRRDGKPIRMLYFICNPFTEKWIAIPLATTHLGDKHYSLPVARLVREPIISTNVDLGGGDDGQQVIAYSEYRFRVVCMYHGVKSDLPVITMDLFCSESGEWIRRTPTLPYYMGFRMNDVRSCNGELFWVGASRCPMLPTGIHSVVARFNPFRPDRHPTFIETCTTTTLLPWGTSPMLTVSQDAVYLIQVREHKRTNDDDDIGFGIWRLDLQEEDDRHSWRKQREVPVKTMKKNKCWCGCERKAFAEPILHPSNPEIVFLKCVACQMSLYSLDFSREEAGEMKLLGKVEKVAFDYYYSKAYSCPSIQGWNVAATAKQQLDKWQGKLTDAQKMMLDDSLKGKGRDGRAELRSSTYEVLSLLDHESV